MPEAPQGRLTFDQWCAKHASKLEGYLAQGALTATERDLVVAAIAAAACADRQDLTEALMRRLMPNARCIAPMRVLPRASLQTWCDRHGIDVRTIEPAFPVAIATKTPFALPYAYQCEATLFASLPSARWVPGWDYVIGADGVVLADTSYLGFEMIHSERPHLPFGPSAAICYVPESVVDVREECLFVSGPVNANVGHWMIDFLPRLRGLAALGRPCRIAVDAAIGRKPLELLRCFGVQESDLVRCSDRHQYRFERLHVFRPGLAMPPNPRHVQFVRERIARPARPKPGKRIYLTRGSVGTRQIANAAEFGALLDELGFVSFDLAGLSIAQQREILADAALLLGADGSHLLGAYFAPGGCAVMALMDEPSNDTLIGPTCAFLDIEYQFVLCRPAPAAGRQHLKKDRDIIVECAELKRRILAIG